MLGTFTAVICNDVAHNLVWEIVFIVLCGSFRNQNYKVPNEDGTANRIFRFCLKDGPEKREDE